jgi:amino acid transporter
VAVNEETEDPGTAPGRAAILSTFVLVGIYVVVSAAAIAFAGPHSLSANSDDVFAGIGKEVFGSPLNKLLIIAVLTSASASTQTTILPTARTSLSMARMKALPSIFGRIHPRYLSPDFSTLMMGALSIVWYVGLTLISDNVLFASIAALGLMIAFYYGITGFACAIYYRRELLKSAKNFFFIGVCPVVGGLILAALFVKSVHDLANDHESFGTAFGWGLAAVIGVGALVLGVVLMIAWNLKEPEFFRRKPEVADPALLESGPAVEGSGV